MKMKTFLTNLLIIAAISIGCKEYPEGSTAKICCGGFCGTAFMTKDRMWVTAAHILEHEGEPILIHPLVGELKINIKKINQKKDLATFQTSMLFDFEPWTLCKLIPPIPAEIYAITENNEEHEYDVKYGRIIVPGFKPKGYTSYMLYMDIDLEHGYSGGPIVYDYNGCVVGMSQGKMPSGYTVGVDVHEIKDFL